MQSERQGRAAEAPGRCRYKVLPPQLIERVVAARQVRQVGRRPVSRLGLGEGRGPLGGGPSGPLVEP
jgi:hypothetical protein